jgi:hypothetical protein
MDPEDDEEPDSESDAMVTKKSGKKQKKGLTIRKRINEVAAEMSASDVAGPNPVAQKRKAGPDQLDLGLGAG